MRYHVYVYIDGSVVEAEKLTGRISYDGFKYYLHSQYPKIGQAVSLYYRCIERKSCQGKLMLKGGKCSLTKEH
jgi:hypothetical protein